jgi:hypothetical protein
MFRRSIVFVLALLAAGAAGCQHAHSTVSNDGALEITVRPVNGTPRLRGRVMLRGIDNALHTQIPIDADAVQSVRVPLPAGSYGLDFEAPLSNDGAGSPSGVASHERLARGLPRIIVVFPQRITTVDVKSVRSSAPSAEELVTSEAPSSDSAALVPAGA